VVELIAAAREVEANVSWHTDSHGEPLGGFQVSVDSAYLTALSAALRGEGAT